MQAAAEFRRLLQEVSAAPSAEEAREILAAADLSDFTEEQICTLQDACPGTCASDEV
jgi:hypothetical protein